MLFSSLNYYTVYILYLYLKVPQDYSEDYNQLVVYSEQIMIGTTGGTDREAECT